jgi:hypothetical protein
VSAYGGLKSGTVSAWSALSKTFSFEKSTTAKEEAVVLNPGEVAKLSFVQVYPPDKFDLNLLNINPELIHSKNQGLGWFVLLKCFIGWPVQEDDQKQSASSANLFDSIYFKLISLSDWKYALGLYLLLFP